MKKRLHFTNKEEKEMKLSKSNKLNSEELDEEIGGEQILTNIRELRSVLQARSNEIEDARRIPDDILNMLRTAGVFRMMMPRAWGGPEMNLIQVNEALEELAIGNASVAWCVMIQNDSGLYSSLLDANVARQAYPQLDMTTSNVVQPKGRAEKVEGGYLINGVWPFASGCLHTDWFAGGCHVFEGDSDTPVLDPGGMPLHRMVLAKREEFTIHDTWHTTGLRGTGSNDIEANNLFVPDAYTFSFNFKENTPRIGTLYSWPSTFVTKMPGVVLGIARGAIETVVAAMQERNEKSERVLLAIADAQTYYVSARSYVNDSLAALWAKLESGSSPNEEERVAIFLARTNAFQSSRKAVQLMYDTMGGGSVYTYKSSLDCRLRDINTACQHVLAQRKAQCAAAELMLGVAEKPFPFL